MTSFEEWSENDITPGDSPGSAFHTREENAREVEEARDSAEDVEKRMNDVSGRVSIVYPKVPRSAAMGVRRGRCVGW